MNLEKLFRDCDAEPCTSVVGCELISAKLTLIDGYRRITKIKNLVTRETRYILDCPGD